MIEIKIMEFTKYKNSNPRISVCLLGHPIKFQQQSPDHISYNKNAIIDINIMILQHCQKDAVATAEISYPE